MHKRFFSSTAIIALALAIGINVLANVIPFNGRTTGEISDLFPVLITPASFTFVIWGVIYGFLILFAWHSIRTAPSARLNGVYILFFASSVANASWIITWHYGLLLLNLILMLVLLFSLIRINESLALRPVKDEPQYWFERAPFQIYLSWICIATIINVTVVLYAAEWNAFGFSPEFWSIVTIGLGSAIITISAFRYHSIPFLIVAVWAFLGIAVKQHDMNLVALAGLFAAIWHFSVAGYMSMNYDRAILIQKKLYRQE